MFIQTHSAANIAGTVAGEQKVCTSEELKLKNNLGKLFENTSNGGT